RGAAIAAPRMITAKSPDDEPPNQINGSPARATVTVSDAMLKTVRCIGLRPPVRRVHCAQALMAAMQTALAGPSANSDQKFTACDSERFDWLRPSGSSIFAADVTTPRTSSVANSNVSWRRRWSAATVRHAAPPATTAATYRRATGGIPRNVGLSVFRLFIPICLGATRGALGDLNATLMPELA